ncbi:hypothetical protein O181_067914 [Austropuccinia psidii MF-1]|uniref:Uncharacterized protein n=1 Tax=Austropuccinia psidii MF-1 TaxID=1389203 RepID=A0A9Q3EWA9_9BASI|nr:hypothetical protein [Austropuccinia psidii MF-1]
MDLDQEIQVITPKDKNVSPEERHKWRMPELPPVPKGNIRDIPVSIQELVDGSKVEGVGTSARSLDRHNELLSSRKSSTDKSLVDKPKNFVRGPEEEVVPRKDNSQVEAPQASTSKSLPQQVLNKEKKTPKNNQKGKQKAKGKAKYKWEKPYQQNYRIPKKEKTAMDNVFNMARTLMKFKNKEEEILN